VVGDRLTIPNIHRVAAALNMLKTVVRHALPDGKRRPARLHERRQTWARVRAIGGNNDKGRWSDPAMETVP